MTPSSTSNPPKGALTTAQLEEIILESLSSSKALDVVVIPLQGKTDIADTMIVASSSSSRHMSAIAEHLAQALKDAGHPRVTLEGLGTSGWVLLDAMDIIVHVFRPEMREYYAIEKMWPLSF